MKIKKISLIIYIFIIIQLLLSITVNATTDGDSFMQNITSGVNSWQKIGENQVASLGLDMNSLLGPIRGIAQIFYWIGCVIVILATILTAVKMKIASETSGELEAKNKKIFTRLLISSFILIGAPLLFSLVVRTFNSLVSA